MKNEKLTTESWLELDNKVFFLSWYEPKTKKEEHWKDLLTIQCLSPFPFYFYEKDKMRLLNMDGFYIKTSRDYKKLFMKTEYRKRSFEVEPVSLFHTSFFDLMSKYKYDSWYILHGLENCFENKNILGLGLSLEDCYTWYRVRTSSSLFDKLTSPLFDKSTGFEKHCA